MKKKKKILLILSMTIISISVANAQITDLDKKNFKRRVRERVALMNDYISYMVDKKKGINTRKYYKTKALPLFIQKGEAYEEDGVKKDGVIMETTSTRRHTTNKLLIKDYFENLINLRYSNVKVTSTQIADMKVSALKRVEDDLYVCTCQYVQYFYGYNADGMLLYGDKTTKRIKCYVKVEQVEDGIEYMIMLGDVKAMSTERL